MTMYELYIFAEPCHRSCITHNTFIKANNTIPSLLLHLNDNDLLFDATGRGSEGNVDTIVK